jgi:hypothetical protein
VPFAEAEKLGKDKESADDYRRNIKERVQDPDIFFRHHIRRRNGNKI